MISTNLLIRNIQKIYFRAIYLSIQRYYKLLEYPKGLKYAIGLDYWGIMKRIKY